MIWVCFILMVFSLVWTKQTKSRTSSFWLIFVYRCQIPGYDQDVYSLPGQVFLNTTGMVSYNVTECMAEVNGSMAKCNSWVYDKDFFQNTIISKVSNKRSSLFNPKRFRCQCQYNANKSHINMNKNDNRLTSVWSL